MKQRVAASSPSHGRRLEIAYVHRAALRRFVPGLRHATLGAGDKLAWHRHGSQWLIERAVLRERGGVLRGPEPATLIDPIDPAVVLEAVRERLREWVLWVADSEQPEWRYPKVQQAYVIESTCRALHALSVGELSSKLRAVGWALDTLPEPWLATVERSQLWRNDLRVEPELVHEVQRFVAWAGARAEALSEEPIE